MKKLLILAVSMLSVAYSGSSYTYKQCTNESKMFTPNTTLGAIPASMRFSNASTKAIKVYWLNFSGQRVLYKTLDPTKSYTQSTYLTAPWVVTDINDNCKGVYFPDGQLRTIKIVK